MTTTGGPKEHKSSALIYRHDRNYCWPAYTQCRGPVLFCSPFVCRRLSSSSVGVCNTPRRACTRRVSGVTFRQGDIFFRPWLFIHSMTGDLKKKQTEIEQYGTTISDNKLTYVTEKPHVQKCNANARIPRYARTIEGHSTTIA